MPIPTRSQSTKVRTGSKFEQHSSISGGANKGAAPAEINVPMKASSGVNVEPLLLDSSLPASLSSRTESRSIRKPATLAPNPSISAKTNAKSRPVSAIISKTTSTPSPAPPLDKPSEASAGRQTAVSQRLGHLRNRSDPKAGTITTSSRLPTGITSSVSTPKPKFGTYQQHNVSQKYQSAHPAKAESRSIREDEQSLVPIATTRLRDELLQLSLVYENSVRTLQQYEASARADLQALIEELRGQDMEVRAVEQKCQRALNASAILAWAESNDGFAEESERLKILSHCVQDLSEISGKGGMFEQAMRRFDKWQEMAGMIARDRSSPAAQKHEILFIDPLDEHWLESVVELERQIQLDEKSLHSLGNAAEGSALQKILAGHIQLAHSMLEEIAVSQAIHTTVMAQQKQWINSSITEITSEVENNDIGSDTTGRRGIWESIDVGS